jgi:hypothetical protein
MVWKKYCSIIPREIILECNCDLMILSFIESAKKLSSTIKNYSLNQKVLGLPFFFFLSFFFLWNFNFSKFYALLKILILLIFLDFILILFIVYSLICFMKLIFLFNLTLQSKIIYFLSCFVFKYNPRYFNCYYFFLIFFCNFFFNFNLSHLIYWNLGFEIFTGLVLLVKWPWSRVHIVFFFLLIFLFDLIDWQWFLFK